MYEVGTMIGISFILLCSIKSVSGFKLHVNLQTYNDGFNSYTRNSLASETKQKLLFNFNFLNMRPFNLIKLDHGTTKYKTSE